MTYDAAFTTERPSIGITGYSSLRQEVHIFNWYGGSVALLLK